MIHRVEHSSSRYISHVLNLCEFCITPPQFIELYIFFNKQVREAVGERRVITPITVVSSVHLTADAKLTGSVGRSTPWTPGLYSLKASLTMEKLEVCNMSITLYDSQRSVTTKRGSKFTVPRSRPIYSIMHFRLTGKRKIFIGMFYIIFFYV